ncbi:succinylglutamate desuccinylase/aspartoacylase domain-containing protein [Chthonobacter albigriseus]|uniref:succinylglutamate desuccinylase/aspartoacylase domain-containing protein n=1 Tax=Chthonobacter albigriseus TaxID=1683161 RepID=UPI0015EEBEBF|nr:succinylglutamate desuccinylase/aspartoacylase family protein [Chthonobacter albigriseus]
MERTVETISGDTPGIEHRFSVLRFRGASADAPTAYLQAALHGNELPGVAALHYLIPMVEAAERDGRLLGAVTVVPYANPIGSAQHHFGEHMGRFSLGSRVNFNRDFPLLPRPDPSLLPGDDAPVFAEKRLKARLVALSLGHDLVLDLHCDDEALPYIYAPRQVWPGMQDLAAALGCEAVIIWDETSDGAFEEAAIAPYLGLSPEEARWERRAISTVELRGRRDVSPELGQRDAAGLYRFLVGRGVIRDAAVDGPARFEGPAVPLDHVEMAYAPAGGAILYHVEPGDRVRAGDPLASILTAPGEAGGAVIVTAPQDGLILTRRAHRLTRAGDDLLKLLGTKRSATAKSGALED